MNKIFIKGLSKLKLLNKVNTFSSATINGHSFKIPIIRGNGVQNLQGSEKWMDEVLKRVISLKAGSFLDVGVNVGQSLLKIKSLNKDVNYYGFEPNPTCILYLNELIKKNKIEKASIFPVGISDKTEIRELNFYYDSDTDSAASIIENFRPWQKVLKKEYIPCYTINDFRDIIKFSSISVIKIDVEGAEMEVLGGLVPSIKESRPIIIMEILPVYKKENNDRLQRQLTIENILKENTYCILRIMKKEDDQFSHFETLSEIGIHSNMQWCDYVFCPGEIVSNLIN